MRAAGIISRVPWTMAAWMLVGLACGAAGCSGGGADPASVERGMTRGEVRSVAGEPEARAEFVVPEGPFHGPQEALAGRAAPGSTVEEWRYETGGEILYVWFSGPAGTPKAAWRVVATAVHPAGAVY